MPEPLPKMGAICAQWVRCGRPTCRCARGDLHGPYHYLFWRGHGRLRKRYIRKADAAAARAACDAHRESERRTRELVRAEWREWLALRARLREIDRHG
jgi:hypothetical protein